MVPVDRSFFLYGALGFSSAGMKKKKRRKKKEKKKLAILNTILEWEKEKPFPSSILVPLFSGTDILIVCTSLPRRIAVYFS